MSLLYLDFAELQAKSHTPMYMKDWVQKLGDFLRLSNRELLMHAGKISAEVARKKADSECEKFRNFCNFVTILRFSVLDQTEQH